MKFFITPNKMLKNNTMPMENIYCDEPPEQVGNKKQQQLSHIIILQCGIVCDV